ncbi:MAG: flagellar assembly protein FliW [Vampirovibrio sp.]|jgi:flagellar assembly factor FliW|nr:flagellar assembly protein FliW [Vampirovibrio sp.]
MMMMTIQTTTTTEPTHALDMVANQSGEGLSFNTLRFGQVTVPLARIVDFASPILGFEGLKQFAILDHDEDSPFKWLQSIEDADLAFVITNPTIFGIAYEFVIPEDAVSLLGIEKAEDTLVFTLVTIPDNDPVKMTANLLGPLVVNQHTRKAMQVILNDNKQYSTKVRLLNDEALDPTEETEVVEALIPPSPTP